jgi:hypothetical protein
VRKALEHVHKGELPGGIEAAMLASIFDQSIMDLNKPISANIADNKALRAMVYHTKDDKTHQFIPMEEGRKGLTKGLTSSLQKLRQMARVPDERTLNRMSDKDIEGMNLEIDEAISQYEDHVKRDNNSIIMLREQNAIMARIVHEQQIHICDLNEKLLLKLEGEKQLELEEEMAIENDIFDLETIMTFLKASLKKRQENMSKIFTPIDFQQIRSTMTKLKDALSSINVLNTQFVKRNNSLTLQLSMVPANIREQITQAILSHSPYVVNQRKHPHCLIADRETKYVFHKSDPNDPMAEELQRGNDFSSIQHLLKEVQDVMNIIRNYDSSRGVDEGIDEAEQSSNAQTAMNNERHRDWLYFWLQAPLFSEQCFAILVNHLGV